MEQKKDIIKHTKYWLEHIIIDLNFCPFAKKEFKQKTIRYIVNIDTELESCLVNLAAELKYLNENSITQTTLLIFSQYASDFDDFLVLIEVANHLINDMGYEEDYQLAHFHPDYCFDGVSPDDASNYTNRAPYPTLHILRVDSVQMAIDTYPDTLKIPEKNITFARKFGVKNFRNILNEGCKSK